MMPEASAMSARVKLYKGPMNGSEAANQTMLIIIIMLLIMHNFKNT